MGCIMVQWIATLDFQYIEKWTENFHCSSYLLLTKKIYQQFPFIYSFAHILQVRKDVY